MLLALNANASRGADMREVRLLGPAVVKDNKLYEYLPTFVLSKIDLNLRLKVNPTSQGFNPWEVDLSIIVSSLRVPGYLINL